MVDLRLVALLTLLVAAPAQARPGDLDRGFAGDGRTAYGVDGGGAVYGLTVTDGRRALLSVGSPYGTQPATLALTAGGRLARRTAFGPPAVSPPWFANGHALTRPGRRATRSRASARPPGSRWREPASCGASGSTARAAPSYLQQLARARPVADDRCAIPAERHPRSQLRARRDRAGRQPRGATGDRAARRASVLHRRSRPVQLARAGPRRRRTAPLARVPRSGRFARLAGPTNLLPAPGGRLLVTGADYSQSGWIARLRADGRPDRRFGVRGLLRLRRFTPYDLTLDRRGRIVLAGASGRSWTPPTTPRSCGSRPAAGATGLPEGHGEVRHGCAGSVSPAPRRASSASTTAGAS